MPRDGRGQVWNATARLRRTRTKNDDTTVGFASARLARSLAPRSAASSRKPLHRPPGSGLTFVNARWRRHDASSWGLSRQRRPVGARPERRPARSPAQIMLRSRRGKPVYLVCDEDTFLAAPDDGLAAAPVPGGPSATRPHARRRRWTRALVVIPAAATIAQLIASHANHDQGRRSRPTDDHTRAAANDRRPATGRARRRAVLPVPSPSASPAQRDRPRTEHHAHARRVRQAAGGPGHPRRPSGPPGRASAPARPSRPTPHPGNRPEPRGAGAAHEFGFEG